MNREMYTIIEPNNTLMICRRNETGSIISSNGLFYGESPLAYASPLLMLQLVVISFLSQVIRFCLSPFAQSSFISQTLTGIILGPSFLGHEKVFTSKLFPESSHNTLETIATFGIMLFFFQMGVKTDAGLIKQCGKKSISIGLSAFLVPLAFSISITIILIRYANVEKSTREILLVGTASQSITGFIVIACLLTELKILNTDLGRLAIGAGMVGDLLGTSLIAMAFPLMQTSTLTPLLLAWAAPILQVLSIVYILRPATQWIIRQTPEGKNVKEEYIFAVFITILVMGYLSEIVGQHYFLGPFFFGLAVPDGPPLGAALVQKLECLINNILLPAYIAVCGLKMNIYSMDLKTSTFIVSLVFAVSLVKIVAVMLSCLYYNMPVKESFVLSIMLNTKGIMELVFYSIWKDLEVLDDNSFSILVITMVLLTAVITPIVKGLYDPSKRYLSSKKCTIQHARRDMELRLLVCVHKQENVPTIMKLIEVSHATEESPVDVFVLEIAELVGRNSAILIYHEPQCNFSNYNSNTDRIINAFRQFESHNRNVINVYPFTAIADLSTMHNDVCNLALDKRVNMVIIPFHKEWAIDGEVGSENRAIRSMNRHILDTVPCSVGILVDRRLITGTLAVIGSQSCYRVAVLFIGGKDDVEALAYAARIAEHETVKLTLIRFLIFGCDNARDRKIDNDTIDEFKLNNASNHRISYVEELVKDGEGFAAVIKGMGECYDLVIVGRHQQKESQLLFGLNEWSDCPEVGVVGDMLASTDVKGMCSVLIVQQAKLKARFASKNDKDPLMHDAPFKDDVKTSVAWTIQMERVELPSNNNRRLQSSHF